MTTIYYRNLFIVLSGVIFAFSYGVHSDVSGTMSSPLPLATFTAFWPYTPRFLVAWLSYKIFGGEIITTLGFRIALAFICWIAICSLLPAYMRRLQSGTALPYIYPAFTLIMFAHYCIPNVFYPYYIYDMPAILFYLIVFLLATNGNLMGILIGCALALLFELNREPIAVALFHAAGWWLVKDRGWPNPFIGGVTVWAFAALRVRKGDLRSVAMIAFAVTLVGMVAFRQLLMYIFTGQIFTADKSNFVEGEDLRLLVNLHRILTSAGFFQQFLAAGFGLVFFLPLLFSRLSMPVKGALLASLVPMSVSIFTNFFVELRIYNEYVPIMACMLASLLLAGSAVSEER